MISETTLHTSGLDSFNTALNDLMVHSYQGSTEAADEAAEKLLAMYGQSYLKGCMAERKRIVNLLMVQHEAAKGAHNYWQVAANLIQAEVASDT